jgi:hypothetical protein
VDKERTPWMNRLEDVTILVGPEEVMLSSLPLVPTTGQSAIVIICIEEVLVSLVALAGDDNSSSNSSKVQPPSSCHVQPFLDSSSKVYANSRSTQLSHVLVS